MIPDDLNDEIVFTVKCTKLQAETLQALCGAPARQHVLGYVRDLEGSNKYTITENEICDAWDEATTKLDEAIMDAW